MGIRHAGAGGSGAARFRDRHGRLLAPQPGDEAEGPAKNLLAGADFCFRHPKSDSLLGYRNLYHERMKTTLNLNDQLLADAKALAAQQRMSLTRLIEEGLQLRLRAKAVSAESARIRLPVFKGRGGLVKGVNPLSNKALLEALGDDA